MTAIQKYKSVYSWNEIFASNTWTINTCFIFILKESLMLTKAAFFDKKYSKKNNIVKYIYTQSKKITVFYLNNKFLF